MEQTPILEAKNISIQFRMYDSGLRQFNLEIISSLDVTVYPGEILAVVGASGSGKSLLAHAILGILPSNSTVGGEILYNGAPLTDEILTKLRGNEIILIPQSVTYLDPLMKVGKQVRGLYGSIADQQRAFARYGLSSETAEMYPFQLSGGMARRVLISTATICSPKLIIADEPTPGLSEEMAKETMRNFRELADEGCGILMITHDLDLALQAADRITVFYNGKTVETASKDNFKNGGEFLCHPYSRALWNALPQNGFSAVDFAAGDQEVSESCF